MLGASIMAGVMLHPFSFGFFHRKVSMWTSWESDPEDWGKLAIWQKAMSYIIYPMFRIVAFPLQCTNWFTGKIWGNVSDATDVRVPDTIWITVVDWEQGEQFIRLNYPGKWASDEAEKSGDRNDTEKYTKTHEE